MRTKSVAFIHYEFPYGGAEVVTSHIAKYLISKGYNVHIFALKIDEAKLVSQLSSVTLTQLPDNDINSRANNDFVIDKLNGLAIDFFVIPSFGVKPPIYIRSKTSCKIIFVHHNMPLWECVYKFANGKYHASKSLGKKLEWYFLRLPRYKLFNNMRKSTCKSYKSMYETVDGYATLCEEYGESIAKIVNVDYHNSKIFALTNPTIEPPLKVNLDKKKQVVYIGRLSHADKRVDRLLLVWSRIWKKFPDWELLIIGEGEARNGLHALAAKLDLGNYKFCGYTNDVTNYLQDAAITCMTSTYEGWGLSLTEAQLYGVVPIAFGCSAGVRKVLSPNGVNGILVEPFDIEEYANRLSQLMSNNEMYKRLQANVIERSKEYNIENIGRQWVEMFKKLESQA